jgi:hypothetical protein
MSSKRQKIADGSIKLYGCQYCEKKYKKPCKLEIHERSHTGQVRITQCGSMLLEIKPPILETLCL